ncbi:DNA mismatch repair protein MutL [Candidatus Entotheonellaceae bacterium PAL068K]
MTPRVHKLDPVTSSRIAAGEVIERPASVVKELLDNALDAGGTRIDIDLQNGGRRLIQVTDNGRGMLATDAQLALQRFTTSKIDTLEDLRSLSTLGFRGEALASITAVAQVEVVTRPAGQQEGALVQSQRHGEASVGPVGCPVGTRVCVHNLFANTPVRLQRMTSISREIQRVQDVVVQYALAHPHVTLQLRHDGRRLLFAPACTEFMQRLPLVLGRSLAAQMLPVQGHSADLHVHGAVGSPGVTRATRQRQYFCVNGRPIRNGLLSIVVERAFGALVAPGRHPLIALGIGLPAELLDVNTHPRKLEIAFLQERAVFAGVQAAVEEALQQASTAEGRWPEEVSADAWSDWATSPPVMTEAGEEYVVRSLAAEPSRLQPLGQIGGTYIVANGQQGLVILDQHAAHEALLYDRLLAAYESGTELEEGLILHLSAPQQQWLVGVQPVLETLRFHLEPFGKEASIVRAVPACLHHDLRPGNFCEALDEARGRLRPRALPDEVREQLSAALSCRVAVRAGDVLTAEAMAGMVTALVEQRLAYTCPHGRPTYLTLTLAELERRFLRFFPLDTRAGD